MVMLGLDSSLLLITSLIIIDIRCEKSRVKNGEYLWYGSCVLYGCAQLIKPAESEAIGKSNKWSACNRVFLVNVLFTHNVTEDIMSAKVVPSPKTQHSVFGDAVIRTFAPACHDGRRMWGDDSLTLIWRSEQAGNRNFAQGDCSLAIQN